MGIGAVMIGAGVFALLLVAADLLARLPRRRPIVGAAGEGPFTLPADFWWGTSTADHQIERAQPDDWYAFELKARAERRQTELRLGLVEPGHIARIADVPLSWIEQKTNFDDHIDDDLARCRDLGNNAFRFSISWARLFPRPDMSAPDPAGLAFYDAVFDACEKHGQAASVTLLHFASPQWLWTPDAAGKYGYERPDVVDEFARFTEVCVRRWGARVKQWCTLNEPMVLVYFGYVEGLFPPLEKRAGGPKAAIPVAAQLLRMHAAAYHIIKKHTPHVGVGIAHHVRHFIPYKNSSLLDRFVAMMVDKAFTLDFMDAIHTGTLRPTMGGGTVEIPGLAGTMDYIGLNYYGRFYVKSEGLTKFEIVSHDEHEPGEEESDVGWAVDETTFVPELVRFSERYGRRPIYVLENGIADGLGDDDGRDDQMRQRFLVRHLQALWEARRQGADVRGFFYWSLIDNFEWAAGFAPRFGLYAVDYDTGARTPRQSVEVYREIARAGGVTKHLWRRYRR